MNEIQAKIRSITELAPTVRCLELEPVDNALDHAAGQYVAVVVGNDDAGEEIVRYYSVASAPRSDTSFELCIAAAGDASVSLHERAPGELVTVRGPGGTFTLDTPEDRGILLVGTGTGVSPLRALFQQLQAQPARRVTLLLGARTEADILYRAEFEAAAAKHPGFHFRPTLTQAPPGWTGLAGRVQEHVAAHLQPGDHVYVCGHSDMVGDIRKQLEEHGVEDDCVHYERY